MQGNLNLVKNQDINSKPLRILSNLTDFLLFHSKIDLETFLFDWSIKIIQRKKFVPHNSFLKRDFMERRHSGLLIILIFMVFSISIINTFPGSVVYKKQNLENNGITKLEDSPIRITNNENFSSYAIAGDGNPSTPWIIENYIINASGEGAHGIHIEGTTDFFILRNCSVVKADSSYYGIYISKATNGLIINNSIKYCDYGIFISNSNQLNLTANIANNNTNGISLQATSDNNTLFNNTVKYNSNHGIYLYQSDNNTLISNVIIDNFYYGLTLQSSYLNNLTHNIVNHNKRYGIYLTSADYNTLLFNVANDNYLFSDGITLSSSDHNEVINNTLNHNDAHGICLQSNSQKNRIINNTLIDNADFGFYIESSSNNTLTNNFAVDNQRGIALYASSHFNELRDNILNDNGYGIYLSQSNYNNITENIAILNLHNGIYLWSSSYNRIINNTIKFSNDDGIYISSGNYNKLINNTVDESDGYGLYLSGSSYNDVLLNRFYYNKDCWFESSSCTNNTFENNDCKMPPGSEIPSFTWLISLIGLAFLSYLLYIIKRVKNTPYNSLRKMS